MTVIDVEDSISIEKKDSLEKVNNNIFLIIFHLFQLIITLYNLNNICYFTG